MDRTTKVIILSIILIIIAGITIVKYNNLSTYDERVMTAWMSMDGAFKDRYASVPMLTGAITLYVGQQLKDVVEASNAVKQFSAATTIQERALLADDVEATLNKLGQNVLTRYPGITSNTQVMTAVNLMQQTKQKIGDKPAAFNLIATKYNEYVRRFPNNIVALIFGFTGKYDYLSLAL